MPPFRAAQERGVGVVHIDAAVLMEGGGSDTLFVRAAPRADAPLLARLRVEAATYRLDAAPPAAEGAALAFGYEEIGLPALEVRGDGWVRVLVAVAADGATVEGWARPDEGSTRLLAWPDLLPGQPLWFLGEPAFHDAPGGAERAIPLAPGSGGTPPADYILWPLEVRGPWLRVEVVTPSDYCFDPAAPRRDTAWVRYLDPDGRPRTWFFTRGC